jgi:hypothetical protein
MQKISNDFLNKNHQNPILNPISPKNKISEVISNFSSYLKNSILVTNHRSLNNRKYRNFNLNYKNDLDNNLKLARNVLIETRQAILYSFNNLSRHESLNQILNEKSENQFFEGFDQIWTRNEKLLKSIRGMIDEEFKALPHHEQSSFNYVRIIAKLAEKYSVGNCHEMTSVALIKLLNLGLWNIRIDLMYIINGDHAFLVLGREINSDPANYKTWGPHAVVCDLWADDVFPATEIENRLMNSNGNGRADGQANLSIFCPISQTLGCFASNLVSPNEMRLNMPSDLTQDQHDKYHFIMNELGQFYETASLSGKLKIAHALLALLKDRKDGDIQILQNSNIIRNLTHQLSYFKQSFN